MCIFCFSFLAFMIILVIRVDALTTYEYSQMASNTAHDERQHCRNPICFCSIDIILWWRLSMSPLAVINVWGSPGVVSIKTETHRLRRVCVSVNEHVSQRAKRVGKYKWIESKRRRADINSTTEKKKGMQLKIDRGRRNKRRSRTRGDANGKTMCGPTSVSSIS